MDFINKEKVYYKGNVRYKGFMGGRQVFPINPISDSWFPAVNRLAYIGNDSAYRTTMMYKLNSSTFTYTADIKFELDIEFPKYTSGIYFTNLFQAMQVFGVNREDNINEPQLGIYIAQPYDNYNYCSVCLVYDNGDESYSSNKPAVCIREQVWGNRYKIVFTNGYLSITNMATGEEKHTGSTVVPGSVPRGRALPDIGIMCTNGTPQSFGPVPSALGNINVSSIGYCMKGCKVYSVNAYKNDVLYSSLVPAKIRSNGKIAFMDRLNNLEDSTYNDTRYVYFRGNKTGSDTNYIGDSSALGIYEYLVNDVSTLDCLMNISDPFVQYNYGNPDLQISTRMYLPSSMKDSDTWGRLLGRMDSDTTGTTGLVLWQERPEYGNRVRVTFDSNTGNTHTIIPDSEAADIMYDKKIGVVFGYKMLNITDGTTQFNKSNESFLPSDNFYSRAFNVFGTNQGGTDYPVSKNGAKFNMIRIFEGTELKRSLYPFSDGTYCGLYDDVTLSTFYPAKVDSLHLETFLHNA